MRTSLVVACALLAVCGAASAPHRFALHLSDFHMDPYYGTPQAVKHANAKCTDADAPWEGLAGCDSSRRMVLDAINASVAALFAASHTAGAAAPPVVYYTGDWLRHDMSALPDPGRTAAAIYNDTAAAFAAAALPIAASGAAVVLHPVLPVALGNEDFIPDYHFNVSQAGTVPVMLQAAATLRSHGLLSSAAQQQTFGYCGFAAFSVDSGLRVLALNTLVYANEMYPPTTEADPCGQLAWMEAELQQAAAAGAAVHLLSHIPPSVAFWKPAYFAAYNALVLRYNATVKAQLFGHTHRFSFIAADEPAWPPLFIGGPVTRISSTQPDFTIMPLTVDAVVLDRVQHAFDPTTHRWELVRSLAAELNLTTPVTNAALHGAARRMLNLTDSFATATFGRFFTMYEGGVADKPASLFDRLSSLCFALAVTFDDLITECASSLV